VPGDRDFGSIPPRPRVLLADDHTEILAALQRMLEPSCEVVGAVTTGRALLEAMDTLRPDVVVLDVSMPEVNGIAACRAIKQTAPHTAVIVLTAADDAVIREAAMSCGASAFVPKYLVAEQLLPAIQQAVLRETASGL
jgi:DNA-binding NarL/FixJ family response regulator